MSNKEAKKENDSSESNLAKEIKKLTTLDHKLKSLSLSDTPNSNNNTLNQHKFWDTQPVTKKGAPLTTLKSGEIKPSLPKKDILQKPFRLPKNFYWDTFDIEKAEDLDQFYELLKNYYVEDEDHSFRFKYTKDFLMWALTPPGNTSDWNLCVRSKVGDAMVASITAIPINAVIEGKKLKMAEVNFLCIHKRLRSKRLAPVLIKEITRRVNLKNVWQAIYTAGIEITLPFSKNKYYHRQLNPLKLLEVNFSQRNPRLKLESIKRIHALPDETKHELRPLEERDAESCCKLLNGYLSKFKFHFDFSLEEFKHWFLPKESVVYCFVAQDKATGEITDMASFYSLPSTILDNPNHSDLRAAYSFYNVSTTIKLSELVNDLLITAKQLQFDVFNSLDVMENDSFFKELIFKQGDGTLYYYLYNWGFPVIEPHENSVILF